MAATYRTADETRYTEGRAIENEKGVYSVAFSPDGRSALTSGRDLWPEPLNADVIGVPWQRIRFRAPIFGLESSVVVSGLFGYGSTVPEDA